MKKGNKSACTQELYSVRIYLPIWQVTILNKLNIIATSIGTRGLMRDMLSQYERNRVTHADIINHDS